MQDIARALEAPAGASSDFDLNPAVELPPGRKLRPAAVLVLILADGPEPQVVLTKRSAKLKHHPGQIAFPGGKQDPEDPTPWACALREAQEEIGADPAAITALGALAPHETVTGFLVHPHIGVLETPQRFVGSDGEVAEVFTVPLSHVTDPARFRVEGRMWQGAMRYYYTVPYGPYYIWGATARILRGLADRLAA